MLKKAAHFFHWKALNKSWFFSSTFITTLLLSVLAVIFTYFFSDGGNAWESIKEHLLLEYCINSLILVIGAMLCTFLFGVPTAWIITKYDFFGKRFLEWALILPLTIPSYIMAYTYAGIFGPSGSFQNILRSFGGADFANRFYFDVMTPGYLILILSLALFPYVYVSCKSYFSIESATLYEASIGLGKSKWKTFIKVILPLARPAIVGGLFLVVMEVLNDFGAVEYFNFPTFTTGIYNAWSIDITPAVKLAAYLLLFVLILTLIEKRQRRKKSYSTKITSTTASYSKATSWQKIGYPILCFIPFLFGFGIPFLQLIIWAFDYLDLFQDPAFYSMIFNSISLGITAVIVIMILALFLLLSRQINQKYIRLNYQKTTTIGYAIPGIIIAIGVLVIFTKLNHQFNAVLDQIAPGYEFLLTGTVFGLIFAYSVRFISVAYNPMEASFEKQGNQLLQASQSLGASNWKIIKKVILPNLKPAILGSSILLFVDIIKELPLTLVLRPYNFETLALYARRQAHIHESVPASALSALIIIGIGIIPILLLNRLMKPSN